MATVAKKEKPFDYKAALWTIARKVASDAANGDLFGSPKYLYFRRARPGEKIGDIILLPDYKEPEPNEGWELAQSEYVIRMIWDVDSLTRMIHEIMRTLPILGEF
jgi:hypothetical protein